MRTCMNAEKGDRPLTFRTATQNRNNLAEMQAAPRSGSWFLANLVSARMQQRRGHSRRAPRRRRQQQRRVRQEPGAAARRRRRRDDALRVTLRRRLHG